MDEIKPPEKMGLTVKRDVPLSLYTFIVSVGANIAVAVQQNVSLVTAYTPEEAFKTLLGQYPMGQPITVHAKGSLLMAEILKMFENTINLSQEKPEPEIIARTKKDFYREIVEGMLKHTDSFISKSEDKPVVEEALKKMLSLTK